MNRHAVRAALSVALLIAIVAYAFVVRPFEATIAARYGDIDTLRANIERDRVMASRLPLLTAERTRLEARLNRRGLRGSRAALVERFLRATATAAQGSGVAVQAIVPGAPPERDPAVASLEEVHLDLTIRGSYVNVLRAMRTLNDADVATQITVATLGNADARGGGAPFLNATVHVTLLRESDADTVHAPHSV